MDGDLKFMCCIIVAVLIALTTIIGIISLYNYHAEKLYVTNGYEQVMLPGSAAYHWQKVAECGK